MKLSPSEESIFVEAYRSGGIPGLVEEVRKMERERFKAIVMAHPRLSEDKQQELIEKIES